jgi:hypothetical protein
MDSKTIALRKDSDDQAHGERFTLMIRDTKVMDQKPETIADLTEAALRDTLHTMRQTNAYADRLLQNARADYLARQQQIT